MMQNKLFLNVQKWLDDAVILYEDENRQAKMHKRRIDLLEGIVKELNERYYQSICQQIWIKLGETYSKILDVKLDRLKATDERPTPHMLTKINNLTKSSIDNFRKFLDSLKEKGTEKLPEEMVKPALCVYFHLGRLYKFITTNKSIQLKNVKNSLDAYKILVNYCEKDHKAAELMAIDVNITS